MQLFYTSHVKHATQSIASKSLGAYVSESIVPNDFFENLFSDVSQYTIQNKNYRETYLIALVNNSGEDVINVKIKFFLDADTFSKYNIAFVKPTKDPQACDIFEEITNSSALPVHATFQDVTDGSQFDISHIHKDKVLGIWLSRSFDQDKIKPKSCSELANMTIVETIERIEMEIDYDKDSGSTSASVSVSSSVSV